jgi:hypothetical protein
MRRSSAPDAGRRRRAIAAFTVPFLGLLAAAGPAGAFDVHQNTASFRGGDFRVVFEGVLLAPPAGIEAVLLDYTRYEFIDPRIRSARLVARDVDGSLRVQTIIAACAGFFCKKVDRVERFEHSAGRLVATVIPAQSDMRRGLATTRWHAEGAGTRVYYEAEFQPDFWVPALVGNGLALRALRESTLQFFRNVEHEANAR